jgi:hypothetical protein
MTEVKRITIMIPIINKLSGIFALAALFLVADSAQSAGEISKEVTLWQIGKPAGDNAEFALAPAGFREFDEDAFYIVGQMDAKTAWPYVQPGPGDAWAGGRAHTFHIIFGVKEAVADGTCSLIINLLDTQQWSPNLVIEVNGRKFERKMPDGGGGESIEGDFSKAKPYAFSVDFPTSLLQAGNNQISVTTVAGSWMLYDSLCLEVPADVKSVAAQTVPKPEFLAGSSRAKQNQLKTIIIVYKTHFDIGYTNTASQVVKYYRTDMIANALGIVDQYKNLPADKQFVWAVPGWPLKQILWDGQSPEIREKLERGIRSGNIVTHAFPFTLHTETAELEDLVRGMDFSAQIARTYGMPLARGAKMTDVPSHTWVLPTLLKNAGIDFIHIGCNDASKPAKVPTLFWWEGPDCSRVLTMYSPSYGTGVLPPEDWQYPAWLYLHMTYDNQGPPSPETVANDIEYYSKRFPHAKIKVGQLQDFSDAILGADCKADIPVVRGDMPDEWVHGAASAPKNWENATAGRAEAAATGALATLNKIWGVTSPDPRSGIANCYEQSLLLAEHTWGAADQSHYQFDYVKPPGEPYMTTAPLEPATKKFMESTWDEKTAYATNLHAIGNKMLKDQMSALASLVNVRGKRIVVFNPLPWSRTDLVEVMGNWSEDTRVHDTDGQRVESLVSGPNLQFIAKEIPAMGYRTYQIATDISAQKSASDCFADEAAHSIENPFFKVTFDPAHGRISSIIDKHSGRELVDDSGPQGFQHFYERFSKAETTRYVHEVLTKPAWTWSCPHTEMHCRDGIPSEKLQPYVAITPSNMNFHATVTPIGVSATLECPASPALPHAVKWTLALYRDLPWAILNVDITHKKEEGWPEALWVGLPFKIANPEFHVGRVGSIINPAKDIIEDTNHRFYWSNFGVTMGDSQHDGAGVGVCPLETPGISLGEPGLMRFDNYTPDKSRVFVNLINNIWHTNFRTWYSDNIHSRIKIWTVEKYDPVASLVTPGFNFKHPLVAILADGNAGSLPALQTGIKLSRSGVLVPAFDPNPEGAGTVLRLWEQGGVSGKLTVSLPVGAKFSTATPVNLRGEKTGSPIKITNNLLDLNLHAYAPATFILNE